MQITEPEMIKKLQNESYFSVKHNGEIVLFVTNKHVYKADGYTLEVSEKLRGGYSDTFNKILGVISYEDYWNTGRNKSAVQCY